MPSEVSKVIENLGQTNVWLEWTSLKVESSTANQYASLFDQFKKDLDVWMKWHTNCASAKYAWTDSIKLGLDFESKVGVSLQQVE